MGHRAVRRTSLAGKGRTARELVWIRGATAATVQA